MTGGTWTDTGHSSNGNTWYGIWGTAANDVWVVGNRHSIAGIGNPLRIEHFDGNTWTADNTLDPQGMIPALHAVWGADATHVFAVGEGGNVAFWNGTMWAPVLSGAGASETLVSVWGSGPKDVWVAGSAGVRHFNGMSWSQVPGLSSPVSIWLSAQ
jgi:hypothetical protein